MTATVIDRPAALYRNERGLFPFQAEGVEKMHTIGSGLLVWDTGTGKSHLAMALGSRLFEEDEIDLVLVCAERNKIREWVRDFEKFTALDAHLYHGTGRAKRLDKAGDVQVLVTTYETAKTDFAQVAKGRGRTVTPGPMMEWAWGKRVLVIYDEVTKLRKRSSANYKAHYWLVSQLRKAHPGTRVVGLTATPIERDWEDVFNQARLIRPETMPTVKDFESKFVRYRDIYDRPVYQPAYMQDFVAMVDPLILRKRKTDPDVIDQFPKQVEESHHVEMHPEHRKLYQMVEDLAWNDEGELELIPGLYTVLRQIAGHPASIIHSAHVHDGLARVLVEELGEEYLRSIPSSKSADLISYLEQVVSGQGAKAVVFSFFGQSVLRELHADLAEAGFKIYVNHGGMSEAAQFDTREAFRADPAPCVLLSSDAGSRGINLPEATYVIEYESALTHAVRIQRINRCVMQGELVHTDHGFIPVEDVEEGYRVLTHTGEWKRVIDSMRTGFSRMMRDRKMVTELSYRRFANGLTVTHDHPLLVSRAGEEPKWIEASGILPGDELVLPRPRGGSGISIPMGVEEADFLYMAGFYLGNGWSRLTYHNRYVAFSTEDIKKDRLTPIKRAVLAMGATSWSIYSESNGGHGIEAHAFGTEFVRAFQNVFSSLRAQDKALPEGWIESLTPTQAQHLLDGYLAADGYERGTTREWVSTSPDLASQMVLVATLAGHSPSLREVTSGSNAGQWIGSYSTNPAGRGDDRFVYEQVLSVKTRFPKRGEAVYDLSVEDDHSFVVGLAAVHNCHRIDSKAPSVTCMTFVLDGTVEEKIVGTMLTRNEQNDQVLHDDDEAAEEFLTAEDRRAMFSIARRR